MDALIASIEATFPDLRWIVRSCDAGEVHIGAGYFAHICNHDYSESYKGTGDSGIAALRQAYERAKAARAA